jgi:hypothetical protein
MTTAKLIHIETGVEYHKNGELHTPSVEQKLLWSLFGTPEGITRDEQTFETEIDEFTGSTKREIETRVNENFKNKIYNFLPAMGVNQNVVLRYKTKR